MRSTILASLVLVFATIFVAGCDDGAVYQPANVPSKLKVRIERLQAAFPNENLTVYAMDFHKEGRTLTFVCPCHIPGSEDSFLNVSVGGDSLKLILLPDAEYKVKVQYWAPDTPRNRD